MQSNFYIKKLYGDTELFDREKLRTSLENSGASAIFANEITDKIELEIRERQNQTTTKDSQEISTDEIYKLAFSILKDTEAKTAMRYSLKRSLFAIGPTGFPFEKYIAKVISKKGYKTNTGVILEGRCVPHEIDVLAHDSDDLIFFEIKFHNDSSTTTDTKTALYVKARYDDLKDIFFQINNKQMKMSKGILLTNTRFTDTAIKYAECAGLSLISWDYPEKGNLYDMIESTRIYPLTCILSLNKKEKELLAKKDILNCDDLKDNVELLQDFGLSNNRIEEIVREINLICRV